LKELTIVSLLFWNQGPETYLKEFQPDSSQYSKSLNGSQTEHHLLVNAPQNLPGRVQLAVLLDIPPPVHNGSDNNVCIFVQIHGEDVASFGLPKKVAYDNEYMRILDIGIRSGRWEYSIRWLSGWRKSYVGREIQRHGSGFRTWLDRRLALAI
jgi:hypothetical protein